MTLEFRDAPTPAQVKSFYDTFSRDRMLSYRIAGNLRIERAVEFFGSFIRANEAILDIGCGIGIATEAMARHTSGPVLGVDISDQNIWYAKKTAVAPNLQFMVADVLDDAVVLPLVKPPSLITMCDVIEHIPDDEREKLFRSFSKIGAPDLRVALSYPTAVNLQYLEEEVPSEIQIIDNKIPPEVIAAEASRAGLQMTYFKMVPVWREVEYAYCAFERKESLYAKVRTPPGFGAFAAQSIEKDSRAIFASTTPQAVRCGHIWQWFTPKYRSMTRSRQLLPC